MIGLVKPAFYLDFQRAANSIHSNGEPENADDEKALQYYRLASLAAHFPLPLKEHSVLDAGCRVGSGTPALAKTFGVITGIDIVPEFVAYAAKKYGSPTAQFLVADLHQLPFKDKVFEWTICSETLEHCYNVKAAANELKRVTSLGLYLNMPLEEGPNQNRSHFTHHNKSEDWLLEFRDWDGYSLAFAARYDDSIHALYLANSLLTTMKGKPWQVTA